MNSTHSWKTTVFGTLMLALAGFSIYTDPAKATDPNVMATIAGGMGLLLAKDGDKTGTASQTQAPAGSPESQK